jgi:hypothetical protein
VGRPPGLLARRWKEATREGAWALSYRRWIPCDDQGRFKDRSDQGFHAINLAGLSDTLADAQLVGYRKGAFTGALKNTPGALDQCAAGRNLFIDEVGGAQTRTSSPAGRKAPPSSRYASPPSGHAGTPGRGEVRGAVRL